MEKEERDRRNYEKLAAMREEVRAAKDHISSHLLTSPHISPSLTISRQIAAIYAATMPVIKALNAGEGEVRLPVSILRPLARPIHAAHAACSPRGCWIATVLRSSSPRSSDG